jgi:hypothetical protein
MDEEGHTSSTTIITYARIRLPLWYYTIPKECCPKETNDVLDEVNSYLISILKTTKSNNPTKKN